MLDRINADISDKTKPNQWTNTNDVIDWFVKILNKRNLSFLGFDIVDFYPSITEDLLSTCLKGSDCVLMLVGSAMFDVTFNLVSHVGLPKFLERQKVVV